MELKVAFVIVCLCALFITSTNAAMPKCCIRTKKVPKQILQKAIRWEMQYGNGACDIDALKLYFRNMKRPICADPVLIQFMKKDKESNPKY